jgi:hypothetical protein
VRVNTSATTATSANFQMTILSSNGPVILRCTSVRIARAITVAGTISTPLGGISYTGCTLAGINVTLTQVSTLSGRFIALLSGRDIIGILEEAVSPIVAPADHTCVAGVGNRFCVGTWRICGLYTLSPPVPVGTLVNWSSLTFNNSNLCALSSRVTRVESSIFGIAVNQAVGITGTFTFSPAINLAGT